MNTVKSVTALVIFSLSLHCRADFATGEELAQAVYDRPNGDDVVTIGVMILTEDGKEPRKRQMYTFGQDKGGSNRNNLIRFTAPADIDGIGMLTLDYAGDKNDQWLYLPALGKVRRISEGNKGGRFVGSDIYNEDLRDREVNMDNHTIKGKEAVKGLDTVILESVPSDPANSTYSKRVSWINTKALLPVKVEFYQDGKLVKVSEARKIEKKQGYWTIMDQLITDVNSGHTTRTAISKIFYDKGLDESVFSRKVLEDPEQSVNLLKKYAGN